MIKPNVAVNLISGALGSGKTTLVRQLIEQKPPEEHWALLINEFGAIGIDGAILTPSALNNTNVSTHEIPGGCICCTAQGDLKQSLLDIANNICPHRLIIEPTGLGEPDTIVDVLKSPECSPFFDIQTLFSVFDASQTQTAELQEKAIFQSLLNMADVILLNKIDLASSEQLQTLENYCQSLFPPKRNILKTQNANTDVSEIFGEHFTNEQFRFSLHKTQTSHASPLLVDNIPPSIYNLPYESKDIDGLIERAYQKTSHAQSIGWVFNSNVVFDWKKLFELFEHFSQTPEILRAKGIFRVGNPRMLFQYVPQQASREIIAYRKDSRLELLLEENAEFDFIAFEQALESAIKSR
ncbi:CobW family GTP-binding protein [Hydrogenovibrio kuenenii]|uniref:CobW family GTP-binding protein n=1 Tax=Hydrogenovibrio kuenenii TaxID=63658 RepID=UPI000465A357|nr:GTP-binding protein [Hydrogenovibrio kuenenii]